MVYKKKNGKPISQKNKNISSYKNMPKDRININNERDRKSLFKQLFKLIINNLFILKREETKEVLLTRNSLFFKPKREKKN